MEASKLKDILEQHKLWIETNGKQGERANLKGAFLYDAILYDANLSHANLTGANLYRANLSTVNFSGADLTGAYLKGAILTNANLYSANLRGANLEGANLEYANLWRANLTDANLGGAYLWRANLTDAILPHISWIIPGCLAQLNEIKDSFFYLEKENKWVNFIQESLGFFIQDNLEEKTFDMLAGDRIIRGIPHWVKYSGMKQIE
jgi:Pentapeptide repeats (8 copies)